MKILPLTFSLLPLLFICGCSNPEKKALDSFKPIITFLGSQTNQDGNTQYSDFSFDIKKTDSLISPFTGVIIFKEHRIWHGDILPTYTDTCHFAQQDGKWVHKSIDIEEEHLAGEASQDENNNRALSQLGIFASKMSLDKDLSKYLGCSAIEPINQ
jgi:hypothetical protein